jgi:hypothetical protein
LKGARRRKVENRPARRLDREWELFVMKILFLLLMLAPAPLLAQSPFDGTWAADLSSVRFPKKPDVYSLLNGVYKCETCVPRIEVNADGQDYPVPGSPYFSTVAVQVIDDRTIQITEKKGGRTVYSETDRVSPDNHILTEKIIDSAADDGQPVTAEEIFSRESPAQTGANPICGTWQAEQVKADSTGRMTVTYHSIADGLEASNPRAEGYSAKFDGKNYPIKGDPAHGTVSLKRVNAHTIIETDKQEGAVHYRLRMTVSSDGKTMSVRETDFERGTKMSYTLDKVSG